MFIRTLSPRGYSKCCSVLNLSKQPRIRLFTKALSTAEPIIHNKIPTEKKESLSISGDVSKSHSEEEYLVKLINDPDTFGTLSPENETVDAGDLEEEKFFEEKALPSQKLSTKKYADLIKSLIEQRKIKEAIDVLEVKMLKEDQFKPENYIYNLLLGACGRVGYTKKAFSLYNDMKKRGLKATPGTYTALFNACSNSPWPTTDGLTRAKHLRNIMIEKMYEPNDTNYNAMIKAFGRCGDISTAFAIVDEMMSKRICLTSDTLNFLFQACISNKDSGFRHALLVWRKLVMMKIQPSTFTYNLLLRTIRDCNLGDIEVTQQVISHILRRDQFMIDQQSNQLMLNGSNEKLLFPLTENYQISGPVSHVPPSSLSNDVFPNLLAKVPHLGNLISLSEVKKPEERLLLVGGMSGFLENMKENNCTPNIKTYTQLLDVIPSTVAAENELLSVMKKGKVKFDVDFFNMIIKKRSLRYDYEGAKEVLKIMAKYKLKPNLITYGLLALGCTTEESALELLAVIKNSKYRLNIEILGAMMSTACYHKKFPYILKLMEICIEENISPNRKFIEHLDNLKTTCRSMMKDKNNELAQSKIFQSGFQIFRLRYKKWLAEVKIEDDKDLHPWQQYKENTDINTDKYYKDIDRRTRFKPRHTSKFLLKTSPKHFQNK
ncbi:hypothetical protein HHI36_020437 [Cryptolaemus montrouzieri]|uniref:Pentatricopeptide repeat-containing protein n=1 Tax=Cryptolaemus montrouzieri TaxID=559131 RepID=A0ABD2NAA1_9CUCU